MPPSAASWDASSSSWECSAARVGVFSHGAGGLPGPSSAAAVVTEARIAELHRLGVRGFDLDLFFPLDSAGAGSRSLYVGHPRRLRQAWARSPALATSREWRRNKSVFGLTSAEVLRASGGALLSADALLALASRLPGLTLALDLKGGGQQPRYGAHLLYLARQVAYRNLTERVWLWAGTASAAKAVHRALSRRGDAPPRLRLGRTILDVGAPRLAHGSEPDCAAALSAAEVRSFAFLGPSLRCTNAALVSALGRLHVGRQLLVWVVDSPAELFEVLARGASAVVSNEPLLLLAALRNASDDGRVRRQCGA